MVNWAEDFLTANPDLAVLPHARVSHGFTFDLGAGSKRSICTSRRSHYFDGALWAPIDTGLVADATWLRGNGTPARIRLSNGAIERGSDVQRASRLVRYRPSNGNISSISAIPTTGTVDGETWSRSWDGMVYTVRLHEEGVQQSLVLPAAPNLPGSQLTDYVMIEEHIPGSTLPDGWLDAPYTDADGYYHPLPQAWAARLNGGLIYYPVRRMVRSDAQGKWLLTGMLVSEIQTARYPLTIDPDYTADSGDGDITGTNAAYATARSTSTFLNTSNQYVVVGQDRSDKSVYHDCYRPFVKFDTSGVGGDTVNQVNMKLVCTLDVSAADFDVQIVKYDWSASDPVAAGNRETVYDGILAAARDDNIWRNTSGMSTNTQYSSGNLNTAWINGSGYTYYALQSAEDYNNSQPADEVFELIQIASQDHGTSGYRPVLVVAHSGGGGTAVKDIIGGYISFAR